MHLANRQSFYSGADFHKRDAINMLMIHIHAGISIVRDMIWKAVGKYNHSFQQVEIPDYRTKTRPV